MEVEKRGMGLVTGLHSGIRVYTVLMRVAQQRDKEPGLWHQTARGQDSGSSAF